MSRPVTPAAAGPLLNATPTAVYNQSNTHGSYSPATAVPTSNQAQNLSRSNSQRQVSAAPSVQGPLHGPPQPVAVSRSNTQRSGRVVSRPTSYVAADGTNNELHDRQSLLQRDGTELSHGGFVNDEDHIPVNDASSAVHRSNSQASQSGTTIPSRGSTLKKKSSVKKSASLKRSGSKKSSYAGSVRSIRLGEKEKYETGADHNSAFHCPVPTSGSPTDLLADRFQAWRKVLKDLISYFRDVQKSYEGRSKTLAAASNSINNTAIPSQFLSSGGIIDATHILREFHKVALTEANKSKELENEVITQLTGLRSDLQQKIKEIKSLSGDFKNSVGKEQESTKKVVRSLQESLGHVDHDANSSSGKNDPFLLKLHVDRQIGKQIEEENYLHRAYLNLEASGRELESIVVGEIQKAYNVLANIMKRDADNTYEAFEGLKAGPLAMAKDHEWDEFVVHSSQMVDPRLPLREADSIAYDGKDHPASIEVKSGMLERKSKYLKNYTPGWYVLSPTHLHEFKSADQIAFQSPVMSLCLPEQKLGTHSEPGSTSHKFMLKGRQTGSMHRGHSWIFRAESHDTMLAWFSDIKELTEKRGEERNEFVRRTHARTLSSGSRKAASIGSMESGIEEDEADKVPFSGEESIRGSVVDRPDGVEGLDGTAYAIDDDNRSDPGWRPPPQRPTPGGRFPSDLNVERGLAAPLSPSSGDSYDETDRDAIAAAGALPGSELPFVSGTLTQPHTDLQQGYDQRSITQSNYDQQNNIQPGYGQQSNLQSTYGQQNNLPSAYGQQTEGPASYAQQTIPQPISGQQANYQSGYEQANNVQSGYGHQNAVQSNHANQGLTQQGNELAGAAASANNAKSPAGIQSYTSGAHPAVAPTPVGAAPVENASNYGEWMAPMGVAAAGGAAIGAVGAHQYQQPNAQHQPTQQEDNQQRAIPIAGQSSGPIVAATAAPVNAPSRPRGITESTQDTATGTSYVPSAHTTSTAAHTSSSVPTTVSLVGTEAPAPSQTLAAAGINPTPEWSGAEPPSKSETHSNQTVTDSTSTSTATTKAIPADTTTASTVPRETTSESAAPVSTESTSAPVNTTAAPMTPINKAYDVGSADVPPISPISPTTDKSVLPDNPDDHASRTVETIARLNPDIVKAALHIEGDGRPELPASVNSIVTISDLHVPGEYPKGKGGLPSP